MNVVLRHCRMCLKAERQHLRPATSRALIAVHTANGTVLLWLHLCCKCTACAPSRSDLIQFFMSFHRYVSVQDVALAHIRAAEIVSAKGRYILAASESSLPGGQIVDILKVRCWRMRVASGFTSTIVHVASNGCRQRTECSVSVACRGRSLASPRWPRAPRASSSGSWTSARCVTFASSIQHAYCSDLISCCPDASISEVHQD